MGAITTLRPESSTIRELDERFQVRDRLARRVRH